MILLDLKKKVSLEDTQRTQLVIGLRNKARREHGGKVVRSSVAEHEEDMLATNQEGMLDLS